MVSGISRIFISILFLAAAGGAARADFSDGKLPDGTYRCEVYLLGMFLNLGDITIKGTVYSGPFYTGLGTFGTAQQGYNYQMDANGVISWLGPLGGYTAGGNSLSLTQATLDGQGTPSFDIIMKQPDGAFTASTCTKN
ncbi:hypothetical protein NKI20_32595 [Mesorhizobium sp. M0830]|uniref:hypothetical protein n=1 Tax=Mesorhizobium sp. M0830 TaxID=2957008 RepID=UPI0033380332